MDGADVWTILYELGLALKEAEGQPCLDFCSGTLNSAMICVHVYVRGGWSGF